MTIEQPKTIDFISVEPATNEVILSISDHLEWDDLNEHLFLLQEKLNIYLSFVESGEILQSYPAAKGRTVVIDLIYKHSPNRQAKDFLDRVASLIHDAGLKFKHRLLPE